MKRIISTITVLIAVISCSLILNPQRSEAASTGRNVILIHGWNGNTESWNARKAQYESNGDIVHVLPMPTQGWSAGDVATNAEAVNDYINDHALSNVVLEGHSLGGMVVEYVILIYRNPAVISGVMLDTGANCTWGIPADMCANSTVMNQIVNAAPSDVLILEMAQSNTFSSVGSRLKHVDCKQVFNLSHSEFLSNAAVGAMGIAWADVNPCSVPVPTSTATPSPIPNPTCTWIQKLFRLC